jgi:hypothetical protein
MASIIVGAKTGSAYDPAINPYNTTTCAVCLEDFTSTTSFGCMRRDPQVTALTCDHVFHTVCALGSVNSRVSDRFECPICRADVTINQDRLHLAKVEVYTRSSYQRKFNELIGAESLRAVTEVSYLNGAPDVVEKILKKQREVRQLALNIACSLLVGISIGYMVQSYR